MQLNSWAIGWATGGAKGVSFPGLDRCGHRLGTTSRCHSGSHYYRQRPAISRASQGVVVSSSPTCGHQELNRRSFGPQMVDRPFVLQWTSPECGLSQDSKLRGRSRPYRSVPPRSPEAAVVLVRAPRSADTATNALLVPERGRQVTGAEAGENTKLSGVPQPSLRCRERTPRTMALAGP